MENKNLKREIVKKFSELLNEFGMSLLDDMQKFEKEFEIFAPRWKGERWEFEEFVEDLFNDIPNRLN